MPEETVKKFREELLDELLGKYEKPEDLIGPEGLLKQLTAALVERALKTELTTHLGYEKHAVEGRGSGNSRNGATKKTLKTDKGDLTIEVPRDRQGSFEPALVKKHQTHFSGFDDQIISLYGRGMTQRDIQAHLQEMYGVEVSADLISRVTDAVMEEVKAWQSRPLEGIYPIVYLDALVLKVREQGVVRNKSAHLAIGVNLEGKKELLGLWLAANEGAKFWMKVITELKNRGVADIFIACCDGLSGFAEAIEAVFPNTLVQTCIVHLLRNSLKFVSWKERRAVAADLKAVYGADTEEAALAGLEAFEAKWGQRYPMIGKSWRENWPRARPFLEFPKEIRKVIYTTNAIESLNSQVRKLIKTRGHFPSDEAAEKLLYLALMNAQKKWTMPIKDWNRALHQFSLFFEGRLSL